MLCVLALLAGAACSSEDADSVDSTSAEPATTTTSSEPATTTTTTIEPATTTTTTEPATTTTTTTEPATTTTDATTTTQLATTTSPTPCPALPIGVSEVMLTAGGGDHPVRVFVPSSFAGTALPTVVNWHGLGSTGPIQAVYSNYETVAELNGFIVVHPSGVGNSWQLFGGAGEARDDVAFANALIDQLIDQWCADDSRIYSTGISNGGLFTARLVCELADRLAAAASIAGTYHPEGCVPERPVPYLAYHGTLDNTVPFDGGGQTTSTDGEGSGNDFFAMVMPEEFAEFAADFGCSPAPATTDVGADVIRYDYAGCDGGTPMAFFEITGGGHTWPGSPLADAVAGVLGYTTDDVDATADSWAFFEQHRLDG